jgi:hypothetical protein
VGTHSDLPAAVSMGSSHQLAILSSWGNSGFRFWINLVHSTPWVTATAPLEVQPKILPQFLPQAAPIKVPLSVLPRE